MALPLALLGIIPELAKEASDFFSKKGSDEVAIKEFSQIMTSKIADVFATTQVELTKRHEADMSSDSFLAKNIRPLVLIYLVIQHSVLLFRPGTAEAAIASSADLLSWVLGFYFGVRGLEKIISYTAGKGK